MPLAGASGVRPWAAPLSLWACWSGADLRGWHHHTGISVLSALEGVNVATDALEPYVTPVAVRSCSAFLPFRARTARIGKVFGPLMLLWFGVIAVLGTAGIVASSAGARAADPRNAIAFLVHNGWVALPFSGRLLAITGGEALLQPIWGTSQEIRS